MASSSEKLTSDQRTALQPAITKITEGFAELQEQLSELGWENGDFSCTLCSCPSFEQRPGLPDLRCARSGCGHFFPRHRVF